MKSMSLDINNKKITYRVSRRSLCALILFLVLADGGIAAGHVTASDLTQLSIEELMNVEIFSAAKKAQKLL